MKLKEIAFSNLSNQEFWAKYSQEPASVVTLQAEIYYLAKRDPELAQLILGSDVIVADGVGLVIGATIHGNRPKKVSGVDLVDTLISDFPATPTYLWGASGHNVKKAARAYQNKGLNVVGFHDGFDGDDESVITEIEKSRPRVVLIGMGNPRQIELVERLSGELGVTSLTVGGTFDVGAGQFKRAPKWVSKVGLESIWRVWEDPKRLKRFPRLFAFVVIVLMEYFK